VVLAIKNIEFFNILNKKRKERKKQMDEINLITKIQKQLKESYQQIGDSMVSGGVDNMEKYKYMLGQAHAYQYISGEISNLLNKGATNGKDRDGKVVDIGKDRSPKA
jgi:hypothetical protein